MFVYAITTLSTPFRRAQAFIQRNARPLDRAIFNYVFDSAPAAQVLAELEPYQNIDGGFGHGLVNLF